MKKLNKKGFTLVELMLSVLVGGIVIAGIMTFFRSQQRSYIAQEEVAETQQELRLVLEIMTRELRNAGHDITAEKTAEAGFVFAGPFRVQVSMDVADDAGTGDPDTNLCIGAVAKPPCVGGWDPNDLVAFGFSTANDPDGNGIAERGAADLGRVAGGGPLNVASVFQPLASNIQAVGFAYAYDSSDADNILDRNAANEVIWAVPNAAGSVWLPLDTHSSGGLNAPDGVIDENDPAPVVGLPANATLLDQIRGVRIWILSRVSRPDPEFVNTTVYKVGANIIPAANDNFRRRLLTVSFRCRNMGIEE